jgi:hypothetical protein
MKDERVARSWGVSAAIVAAVVCIAAVAVALLSVQQMTKLAAVSPAGATILSEGADVAVRWQSQSYMEARFTAKIAEGKDYLKDKLMELADPEKEPDLATWREAFKGHFLRMPRLIVDGEATEGWEDVLPKLREIVKGKSDIKIGFAWGMIEYVPYDKDKRPPAEDDVDFRVRIKVGFSASPGDNILEGELLHRRICDIS